MSVWSFVCFVWSYRAAGCRRCRFQTDIPWFSHDRTLSSYQAERVILFSHVCDDFGLKIASVNRFSSYGFWRTFSVILKRNPQIVCISVRYFGLFGLCVLLFAFILLGVYKLRLCNFTFRNIFACRLLWWTWMKDFENYQSIQRLQPLIV